MHGDGSMVTNSKVVIHPNDPSFKDHMDLVQARYDAQGEDFKGIVQEKLEFLRTSQKLKAERRGGLIHRAFASQKNSQRVFWLRKEADYVSESVLPVSACASGCNHCCNIGILVSEAEAKVISKEIGVPLAKPQSDRMTDMKGSLDSAEVAQALMAAGREKSMDYFGQACTFLVEGKCSIYAHRPMACRQLFNMDQDDLLCQLVGGVQIRVPYFNQQEPQIAYLLLWGQNAKLADLREWFPSCKQGTSA